MVNMVGVDEIELLRVEFVEIGRSIRLLFYRYILSFRSGFLRYEFDYDGEGNDFNVEYVL